MNAVEQTPIQRDLLRNSQYVTLNLRCLFLERLIHNGFFQYKWECSLRFTWAKDIDENRLTRMDLAGLFHRKRQLTTHFYLYSFLSINLQNALFTTYNFSH